MITEDGPKVLEYNVRFGDPETEALMLLLSDETDLAQVLLVSSIPRSLGPAKCYQACAEHRLDSVEIRLKPGVAVSVILASEGYPGSYPKGRAITIPQTPSNVVVFHAGTAMKDDNTVTSGGRVLAVTAYGDTVQAAIDSAYQTVNSVHFEGKTYRRDIAHRLVFTISSAR